MKALTTLLLAVAAIGIGYRHLKHDYHDLTHAFHGLVWPLDDPLNAIGPLALSALAILIGLLHVKHSIKELLQRSVITAALTIMLALSLVSLVVGGGGMLGLMLYWRVTGSIITDAPPYVLWMLGMAWGGAAGAVASLFTLAAVADRADRTVGGEDRLNSGAAVKAEPVKTAPAESAPTRPYSTGYERPVPPHMNKYLA